MEKKDLDLILAAHVKWRHGEDGGSRANLAGADLAGAYLAGAYLADANLAGANLAGAYLARAKINEWQEASLLAALRIVVVPKATKED